MQVMLSRYLLYPALALFGLIFSYRLLNIPSRMETAVFMIVFFLVPTLKYPKFGVYYIFCLPLFIPLFRRMYYLVSERPALDYLMLISDGVMGGLIIALLLLWILNKERSRDPMSILIVLYTAWLFIKVFVGNYLSIQEALYGFKFNGLYVMFFFAGSYVLTTVQETRKVLGWVSWLLLITALYGVNQILFGFTSFEQKWLDSITFTTLRIDGVVRPFSTYVSPASMADGMVILFVLGLYWIIAKGRHMAPFGMLLIASCIAPLLIATVRTNWLATAAGLFFFVVFLRIRNRWAKIGIMVVMISGIGIYSARGGDSGSGSTTATQATHGKSLAAVMITNRTAALANPLQEYSVQKRMEIWTGITYYSFKYPFGRGQGTTGYAHSYYFLILGELGYPGLFIFLAILIVGFYRGFKVIAIAKDEMMVEITRLLVTIVFMISVLNLTGTHLHTTPGDIFFWFSLGTISRFYRQVAPQKVGKKKGKKDETAAVAGTEHPEEAHSIEGGALPHLDGAHA